MKILVISGFLGAGKTTFIKEIHRRTGYEIAVMENEYGEVGVDKTLLEGDGKINIWELTEGCICCSVKSDFASSILTIANTVEPEYLLVEPTGVGMLSRVMENIRMVSYDRIRILPPLTILDPGSFERYRRQFGEIYEDQIRAASRIILSKGDLPVSADIGKISSEIRKINPQAELVTNHYRNLPDDWWRSLFAAAGEGTKADGGPTGEKGVGCEQISGRRSWSDSNNSSHLENLGIRGGKLLASDCLPIFLENLIRGLYGDIVRAKGFIHCGSSLLRFDMVDRGYSITGVEEIPEQINCVFIGQKIKKGAILKVLHAEGREKKVKGKHIQIRI